MQTFEMVKTVALATVVFLLFSFLWAVVFVAVQSRRTKATGISAIG